MPAAAAWAADADAWVGRLRPGPAAAGLNAGAGAQGHSLLAMWDAKQQQQQQALASGCTLHFQAGQLARVPNARSLSLLMLLPCDGALPPTSSSGSSAQQQQHRRRAKAASRSAAAARSPPRLLCGCVTRVHSGAQTPSHLAAARLESKTGASTQGQQHRTPTARVHNAGPASYPGGTGCCGAVLLGCLRLMLASAVGQGVAHAAPPHRGSN